MAVPDRIAAKIAREDAQAEVLRKFKASIGVGFGAPEPEPLVEQTVEVVTGEYMVESKSGAVPVRGHARALTLFSGETVFIGGGEGNVINEEDMSAILGGIPGRSLTEALTADLHQKISKLV